MKLRNRFQEFVLYMLLGSLFSYGLTAQIIGGTTILADKSTIFGCCFLMLAVLYFVFYNKYTVTVFLCFTVLFILFMLFDNYFGNKSSYVKDCYDYLMRLSQYIRGYTSFRPGYAMPLVSAISFAFAFIFLIFYRLIYSSAVLITAGLSVFIISVLTRSFVTEKCVIMFLIFSIVIIAQTFDKINKFGFRAGFSANVRPTLFFVPICLCVVVIASNIPAPDYKFRTTVMSDFFRQPGDVLSDVLYLAFNPKYFSFGNTGFSPGDSKLGGDATVDDTPVLSVRCDTGIYLTGETKSEYTGHDWLSEKEEFKDYFDDTDTSKSGFEHDMNKFMFPGDMTETLRVMMPKDVRVDALETYIAQCVSYIGSYIALNSDNGTQGIKDIQSTVMVMPSTVFRPIKTDFEIVEISVLKRTGTLFYPSSMTLLNSGGQDVSSNDYSLRTDKLLKMYQQYGYYYLPLKTDKTEVTDFLRKTGPGFYARLKKSLPVFVISERGRTIVSAYSNLGNNLDARKTLDFFSERADEIRSKYTQLPGQLPERVRLLALDITKDCENEYDKSKAIESYLRSLSYTLTPGQSPENRDFVDYFLFDTREGYCTHFATSFSVLCRSLGIPVRYNEGYSVAGTPDADGWRVVTNANAHAWPEVYFEGYGWVPFEPTPGYDGASAGANSTAAPTSGTERNNPNIKDDFEEDYQDPGGKTTRRPRPTPAQKPDSGSEASGISETFEGLSKDYAVKAGFSLLGMFALFVVLMHARRYYLTRRLDVMDRNSAAVEYFKKTVALAGISGIGLKPGHTALTYAEEYSEQVASSDDVTDLVLAARAFNRASYSREAISDSEYSYTKKAYVHMNKRLQLLVGRVRYHLMICFDKRLR